MTHPPPELAVLSGAELHKLNRIPQSAPALGGDPADHTATALLAALTVTHWRLHTATPGLGREQRRGPPLPVYRQDFRADRVLAAGALHAPLGGPQRLGGLINP